MCNHYLVPNFDNKQWSKDFIRNFEDIENLVFYVRDMLTVGLLSTNQNLKDILEYSFLKCFPTIIPPHAPSIIPLTTSFVCSRCLMHDINLPCLKLNL